MKAGFLAREAAKQTTTSLPAKSIPEPAEQPTPLPTTQPSGISAAADSQLQEEASWQQCLELLRSEVDEKKFVGLLLVTKLLPQATDIAIQQVLDAVGLTFIQRLLLPLHRTSQHQLDEAKLQQQHLSVVLGLSILSVTCRLPAVNSSEEVLQLLPLLLKVAAAGGVAPVLQQQAQQQPHRSDHLHTQQNGHMDASSATWAGVASEAASAADALECAVACVASDNYHCAVGLESGALPLTVMALHTALRALSNSSYSSSSNGSESVNADPTDASAGVAVSRLQAVMLSTQLLGLLLSHPRSTVAAAQHPGAAAAAVILLSQVLGAVLGSGSSSTLGSGTDAAAIQLEAQHTLLLLLPLIQESQAADLLQQAAAASAGRQSTMPDPAVAAALAVSGDWPAALRHGLCQLLCSRTGAVQRHSALRLAAAITDVLGDSWLLPTAQQQQQQQHLSPSSTTVTSSDSQQPFLLVLMEILAIETPLLLSDAMNPEAVVPRADISMTTRSATAAVAAKQQQQQEDQAGSGATVSGHMNMETDSDGDADHVDQPELAPQPQPLTVQQILQQVQQQEASASSTTARQQQQQHASNSGAEGPPGFQVLTPDQQQVTKSLQQRLAELQLPDEKDPGPGQQRAGTRAEQLLPACFQLLECCCDVLVSQADALEQQHDTSAAADGIAVYAVPLLVYKEVQQLMMRLQQVTQALLEYLDYATSPPTASDPVNPLLTAGAVRVLGRFLADAPDVHSEAVQKLLPRLLAVAIPGEPTACGVSFLLPALLTWTSSSNSKQQQWVAVLIAENQGLAELGGYTASLAAAAAAGAAGALAVGDGCSCTREQSRAVEEGQLGTACQVLQQMLSSLPTAVAQQKHQHEQQQLNQQVLQTLVPVLDSVCKWANTCIPTQHYRPSTSATPAAVALGLLQAVSHVPSRLPVLLAAASLSGRLLALLGASQGAGLAAGFSARSSSAQHTLASDVATSAGQLLCWGCAAGWSCQLMQVLHDRLQQKSEQDGPDDTLPCGMLQEGVQMDMFESIMSWMEPIWEDAELGEFWDVCLTTAAELLLADSLPGLRDVFSSAAWVVPAKQTCSKYEFASSVMVAHVELQMLLQAVGRIG